MKAVLSLIFGMALVCCLIAWEKSLGILRLPITAVATVCLGIALKSVIERISGKTASPRQKKLVYTLLFMIFFFTLLGVVLQIVTTY
jgi:hypothetical protein